MFFDPKSYKKILTFIGNRSSESVLEFYKNLLENLEKNQIKIEIQDLLIPFIFIDLYKLDSLKDNITFYHFILFLMGEIHHGNLCACLKKGDVFYPFLEYLLHTEKEIIDKKEKGQSFLKTEKPLIVVQENDFYWVYFQKQYNYFLGLKQECEKYLPIKNVLEYTKARQLLQNTLQEMNFFLNEEQEKAVMYALTQNFHIIKGGPGTGKTTVIKVLLECLLKRSQENQETKMRITLLAPTGKAVTRIKETLENNKNLQEQMGNIQIETINRFITNREREIDNSSQFYYNQDMFIIDELSMVSSHLMQDLFSFISPESQIVLLGDPYQIPSIEEGDVFGFFMDSRLGFEEATTSLTHLIRSEDESLSKLIIHLQQFNFGNQKASENPFLMDSFLKSEKKSLLVKNTSDFIKEIPFHEVLSIFGDETAKGVFFADIEKVNDTHTFYRDFFNQIYMPFYEDLLKIQEEEKQIQKMIDFNSQMKILSPLRKGNMGCDMINEKFYEWSRRSFSSPLFLPYIINSNLYEQNLFNGDFGVIIEKNNSTTFYTKQAGVLNYHNATSIPHKSLGFASTVHKSQGSEFESVLLLLPFYTPHHLLTRQIFYTGISRAKKKVIILGLKESLTLCLNTSFNRINGAL